MDLLELDTLLNQTPVIAHVHPVSLALLEQPVKVFATAHAMAMALDANETVLPERWLTLDANPRYLRRFPEITCTHSPFTPELNRVLLEKYNWIMQQMLSQSQIAERITNEATGYDVIVLVLLDGLSYADCQFWPNVAPCLTVLPSITRVCFPAIINDPPIASRLFLKGFERRVGFTYWSREVNPLTDHLFRTIRDVHLIQNQSSEILDWMRQDGNLRHTYLQIMRPALDDYADGIRSTVPRAILVRELWDDLCAISNTLKDLGLHARIYATADHGLLWKDTPHPFEILAHERGPLRYGPTRLADSRGRWAELDNSRTWVLDYPQLRRAFKNNEQGTHGGVSFEECITPFLTMEV